MMQNSFSILQSKTYVPSADVRHFMKVAATLAYAQ